MAEVISTTLQANSVSGSTKPASRPGRKSNFTFTKDLIIAQEVSAAEADVAPHGKTFFSSDTAAYKAKQNPNFGHNITGKYIQDRLKKLIDDFRIRDGIHHNLPRTGSEIEDLIHFGSDFIDENSNKVAKMHAHAKKKAYFMLKSFKKK